MKKKSRNKHLLKKRRKKQLLNALAQSELEHPESFKMNGKTDTPLGVLHVGDVFTVGDETYSVVDSEEVGGYIACVNNRTGEQEWLSAQMSVL